MSKYIKGIKHGINKIELKNKKAMEFIDSDFFHEWTEFQMINVSAGIANGLRRVMIGEIPVKYLYMSHMETDDRYVLSDKIQQHINCIPIMQDVEIGTKFVLEYRNNTSLYKTIRTKEIKPVDKKLLNKKFFDPNFRPITLEPSHWIKAEFEVRESMIYDYRGISLVGRMEYEPIMTDNKKSIMEQKITKYRLRVMNNGTNKPVYIIKLGLNTMLTNLKYWKGEFETVDSVPKQSGVYKIYENNVTHYIVNGERDTLGKLIFDQVFEIEPGIQHISYGDITATDRVVKISVIHPESDKLIVSAISSAINIYTDILKAF